MYKMIDFRNEPRTDSMVASQRAENWHTLRQILDPRGVAFITCVSDETQYNTSLRYIDALQIPSGYAVEKIGVVGAPSMAEGYQRALQESTAQYKIYIHQDVYIIHRRLLHDLIHLFRTYPRLGMVGVIGTTRLPTSGIWWVDNSAYSYGRVWVYATMANVLPGIPLSPSAYRRRLRFMRLRSFVGDYLPAAALDGLLLATQYDVPWTNAVGGFMLYDQVQSLAFVRAGLEVGIARQEAVWCLHWGPLQERSREQRRPYDLELARRAAEFRRVYHTSIGVPVEELYKQAPKVAEWPGPSAGRFGKAPVE